MSEKLTQITKTLSERENISAIIWLIIGILQCLTCVGAVSGGWNIYCAVTRFKSSKAVLTPWQGIVASYDKWLTNIIIGIVINVLFGGVIGVVGSLYDLFAIRDFVLKNKDEFEAAGL